MKVGILITTFNRPQYLKECLESLGRADIPEGTLVIVVDDSSTDEQTKQLLNDCGYTVIRKNQNKGIKDSLMQGYQYCFGNNCGLVINLDGDAVVRNDFVEVLLKLKKWFPDFIVSGFNTTVENRNPVDFENTDHFLKKYASGINICIDNAQYLNWVRPALNMNGNWDFNASVLCGVPVVVSKPSVVQHIGLESSMGHTNNGVKPDVAEDFKPLRLPNVTLFGIAYNDPEGLHRAAEISQQNIIFGDVVIITEKLFEGRVGYSHFCMKELNKYVKTDYVLKIEPDGYVQNWRAWDKKWLEYDVIGAPWLWYDDNFKIGNGISLRSKKLYDILATDDNIVPTNDKYIKEHEEDHNIGRIYRPYLEREYGIKFASLEDAKKFSIEAWRSDEDTYSGQFCFHGYKVKGLPFPPLSKKLPA